MTSSDTATGTVGSTQPATDAVVAAEVLDGSITTAKLANNAVTNAKSAQMAAQTLKGNASAGAADPSDLTVADMQLLLGASAVDLRSAPYFVVADDPDQAAANSDAITQAISDYSGTGATLLLPQGKIYCERNDDSSYCIKFGVGVSKLTLRGQGMRGTTIVQQGVGNGGDWHCLVFENCQNIEVCDLGITQGVIECPEATQQQHLVFIRDTSATTQHIDLHDIFFGDCLGDMYRTLAESSPDIVRDVSLRNFVMEGGWPNAGNSIIQAWEAVTQYQKFAWVRNDSNKQYKCTVAGKSASSGGPTGTGTPFSWTPRAISAVDAQADTLTITAHGLKYGDGPFRFTTVGSLPHGLDTGRDYWISKIIDADKFKVSTKLDDPALIRNVDIQSTGDATLVAGPGLQHLDIVDGDATWQYVLHGPRGGARSGVSPQRGYSRMLIADGYINGVQNSAMDCEPTGANTMEYLTADTVFVNNINSKTSTACSFGGDSSEHAKHMVIRNLTVLGGDTIIGNVDDMLLDNFHSIGEAAWPADTRTPNLTVRQVCANLTISNIRCERTGTSANGACIDIALDVGSKNLSIVGGSVLNSTTNETILIGNTGPNCFIGGGLSIEYTGGSASDKSGIALTASSTVGADNLVIDGVRVKAPDKLKAAVSLATRNSKTSIASMANLTIRNIDASGQATNGVYASFDRLGIYDRTPVFESICNGTELTWVIKDENNADLTTVYPIVSGGRGSNAVRRFEGQAPPNSNLVANLGDVFTWSKAPTYSETWIKMTQAVAGTPDNTGWVLVPGGAERKSASGSADPNLALTVVSGSGTNLDLADGPSHGYRKMFIVVDGTGKITPTHFLNKEIGTTGPCACELVWLADEAKWALLSATTGAVVG